MLILLNEEKITHGKKQWLYYCFYYLFDQMHIAMINLRDFFQNI